MLSSVPGPRSLERQATRVCALEVRSRGNVKSRVFTREISSKIGSHALKQLTRVHDFTLARSDLVDIHTWSTQSDESRWTSRDRADRKVVDISFNGDGGSSLVTDALLGTSFLMDC